MIKSQWVPAITTLVSVLVMFLAVITFFMDQLDTLEARMSKRIEEITSRVSGYATESYRRITTLSEIIARNQNNILQQLARDRELQLISNRQLRDILERISENTKAGSANLDAIKKSTGKLEVKTSKE